MEKPTIFFSHSSKDKDCLVRLKDLFVKKTGGSIDVFLSSDGQSIRIGSNWRHSLEQALDSSKIMFVFVTPSSLQSNWIFFESGYAYSRNKRVVPVGFLGIDILSVPEPLSQLNGYNLDSYEGLNNLLEYSSEGEKDLTFSLFEPDDYASIVSCGGFYQSCFGDYLQYIEDINVGFQFDRLMAISQLDKIQANILKLLDGRYPNIFHDNFSFIIPGLAIHSVLRRDDCSGVEFRVDSLSPDSSLLLAEEIINIFGKKYISKSIIHINFNSTVIRHLKNFIILKLIQGEDIKLFSDKAFHYKDIEFELISSRSMSIRFINDKFYIEQIGELFGILSRSSVIS